jgi:hypothetical protein
MKSNSSQKQSTRRNAQEKISNETEATAAAVNNDSEVIFLCGTSDEDEESTVSFNNESPTKSNVKEEAASPEKNGAPLSSDDTVNVEIDEIKKEIEIVKQENDQFKREIDELKREKGALNIALSTKIRRVETLEKENSNLRKVLDQLRKG